MHKLISKLLSCQKSLLPKKILNGQCQFICQIIKLVLQGSHVVLLEFKMSLLIQSRANMQYKIHLKWKYMSCL